MGSSHSRVQPGTPNLLLTNMPEEAWLQSPLALEPTVSAHRTLYRDFLFFPFFIYFFCIVIF